MSHERCEACGFDGARYDDPGLLGAIRALGPRWRSLLAASGPELRLRPGPQVWSAIEYAAHSRDITALHVFGVEQALTGEEPVLPAVAADDLIESAAATYGGADPDAVAAELARQAVLLARLAQDAGSDAWTRGLTVGDDRRDVRELLEHALHDSVHHLADVERGLARLREGRDAAGPGSETG
ncbi:MAG TPA: DinB family protein [Acidimicrobiales bacterium]|nr:DinB family protein [Acidimicrobiales bacterium]